eukprot:5644230-Alexandrium_andersonii.AAC.1
MSASLVGSEMCIRDSERKASKVMRCARHPWHPAPKPEGSLTSQTQMSVSYTHLTLPTICSV